MTNRSPRLLRPLGCAVVILVFVFGMSMHLGLGRGPSSYEATVVNRTRRTLFVGEAFSEPPGEDDSWYVHDARPIPPGSRVDVWLFYERRSRKKARYSVGVFERGADAPLASVRLTLADLDRLHQKRVLLVASGGESVRFSLQGSDGRGPLPSVLRIRSPEQEDVSISNRRLREHPRVDPLHGG